MKKFIILALVLAATTLAARAQSAAQKDSKTAAAPTPVAEAKNNPLYQSSGSQGSNPLYKGDAKTEGSPIGGIVVKGGHNGLQSTDATQNTAGATPSAPASPDAQKSTGNPIGGIIVKGGKSISEKGIK